VEHSQKLFCSKSCAGKAIAASASGRKPQEIKVTDLDEKPAKPSEMKCVNHPEVDAIGICVHCHKPICHECSVESSNLLFCSQACAGQALLDKAYHKQRATPQKSNEVAVGGKFASSLLLPRQIVPLSGAILAILCFFLPWLALFSADNQISGFKLIQDYGRVMNVPLLWLTLVVALAGLGLSIFYSVYSSLYGANYIWIIKIIICICAVIGTLIMIYEYIDFKTADMTFWGQRRKLEEFGHLTFGFFGMFLGYIMMGIGALRLPNVLSKTSEDI